MSEQTAIMIELEGQNYAGPPQPSMESFLPYVPDIVCISFQWSHHTCLRPAMVILLNLIIPERNVENDMIIDRITWTSLRIFFGQA